MISALYSSPIPRKKVTASSRDFTLRADRDLLLDDLLHLLFDLRQVVGREGALVGEVVIEAVVDHRADRDLRAGEQALHGLRQQVRGGMAQDIQRLGALLGDDLERGVMVDR